MAAAMILALCAGIVYTWSVFQKPIMESFGWSIESVSLTYTLQILASTITPIFIGKYQKRLGVKNYLRIGILIYVTGLVATMFASSIAYLYIVYGLVVGVGISMLYPCLMSYGGSIFPERTGMAAGLIACAYGGGSIIWAPLAASFIERHGTLPVFGMFAILFAVVMLPVSFLIKEAPEDFQPEVKKKYENRPGIKTAKNYTWKEMIKTSRYYIIIIILTLGTTAGLMVMGHASSILQEMQGFTPAKAAFVLGIISIFNAFGRVIFGTVSDKLGRYPVMMLLFAIIGGAMLLLTKADGLIFIMALGAISMCYGGFTAMFSPVCADNFGIRNLSTNYGFLFVAYGLAGVIGPQLAARAKEFGGGYNFAFITVAILAVIGFVLTLYLITDAKKRQQA